MDQNLSLTSLFLSLQRKHVLASPSSQHLALPAGCELPHWLRHMLCGVDFLLHSCFVIGKGFLIPLINVWLFPWFIMPVILIYHNHYMNQEMNHHNSKHHVDIIVTNHLHSTHHPWTTKYDLDETAECAQDHQKTEF